MIHLKSEKDIESLRESGRILAKVLSVLSLNVKEGIRLKSLDNLAMTLLKEAGAKPAFLGYIPEGTTRPFPAAVCASLNSIVVHGIPSSYRLKSGDILKIDLGVNHKGFFTDAAVTKGVGRINSRAAKLLQVTQDALRVAIAACQSGGHLGDIGFAIESVVRKGGFKVVKGLTGHGVGFDLHEDPEVYNYGRKGEGLELKPGLVLAIEPMASAGSSRLISKPDGSFETEDKSLTAHFEHTVAITESGPEILTL